MDTKCSVVFCVYNHFVNLVVVGRFLQKFREKSRTVGDSFKVVVRVCNTLSDLLSVVGTVVASLMVICRYSIFL